MPTYAGVPLLQPSPELCAHVAYNISLQDVCEFVPAHRLTKLNIRMPYEGQTRPVKLGSLYWPVGASRWAVGHFLASESQLTTIRAAGLGAVQELTISDGTTTIETNMHMLPPRPLAQNPMDAASFTKWLLPKADFGTLGEPVYLITLVDDRYYWWDRVASSAMALAVTAGTTTWAQLFAAIAAALGITLTVGTIAAAYLKPPADLSAYQEYLPVLLDVAAMSVGHRVVRALDGSVSTQTASAALTSVQAQIAANLTNRTAGGQFAFNVS